LTPSARSGNLIAGDGTKNGLPAPNKELTANPKQPLDRKSPIQVSCELKSFRGVRGAQQKTGAAETFSLALSRAASTSADHGLRVRRHGGDVAAVWREKQTEAGSDDRIALEGTGEMIEIPAE